MPTRKKIGLIGAGNIGGELARLCANEELGDVFLYDIPAKENFAKGKALDLEQNGAVLGYDANIRGTGNWADLEGADVLIITAGIPRKPGQSRDDLVASNLPIIRDVANNAKKVCPNAFVIVISNPLDAMVYEYRRVVGAPKNMVVGHGGRPRQRALPALPGPRGGRERQGRAADGPRRPRRRHGPRAVDDDRQRHPRLGAHREGQARQDRRAHAQGRRRDRQPDGDERLLRAGVQRRIDGEGVPARREAAPGGAAYLDGEYGYNDLFMGVPCVIGGKGVEKIVEIPLTDDEKAMLAKSAKSVQAVVDICKKG